MEEEIINQEVEQEVVIEEQPVLSKKEERKAKRRERIKNRFFKEEDIKYEGPLSYRALRIIAWIFLALGQMAFFGSIAGKISEVVLIGEIPSYILSIFGGLSTPLFIIASFGLILSHKKTYRDTLIFYGGVFILVGVGLDLFILRYVNGLVIEVGASNEVFNTLSSLFEEKMEINVFTDLFAFALFHFFVNYVPTKYFVNKKIIIFRLFSVLPVLYIFASTVLKALVGFAVIDLPVYVYPFLITKSPFVFLIFVITSIWIKNREKLFLKMGATQEEYKAFLTTKRNSLSVSINLSIIIAVFALIDLIVLTVLYTIIIANGFTAERAFDILGLVGLGDCLPLLLVIPFILLYSYNRTHKKQVIDIVIPIAGVGLIALIYIELSYQLLINFFKG